MTRVHLRAGVLALACFAAVLAGVRMHARTVEARYVAGFVNVDGDVKYFGRALQQAAFQRADLLPVYGASEILYPGPYHAANVFRQFPTGFQVFPVAWWSATPIVLLQKLGALGSTLTGRKVVLTLTPPLFYRPPLEQQSYLGNFTALHATALLFSDDLPRPLKRAAARRMRQYPGTLTDQPLLERASAWLVEDTLACRAAYAAAWPLGKLQEAALSMQDHWAVVRYVDARPKMGRGLTRSPGRIDWDDLERSARRETAAASDNNPFGFENSYWDANRRKLLSEEEAATAGGLVPVIKTIVIGLRNRRESDEWRDLDLLLDSLRALGATPLVVAAPFHGPFYDRWGITAAERMRFYDELRRRCTRAGVAVVDFAEHDGETLFLRDPESHLSGLGWVQVSKVLDAFYHDQWPAGGTR